MSRVTLRLVLLVSCAHALAHAFELSLPGVEEEIAREYGVGKSAMGWLAACWRGPWGFGSLLAGLLVDRYGGKRMLAIYLLGAGAMCLFAGTHLPLAILFVVMFAMGSFASIYHPAGLALISHETNADNRPFALGIHGVFGSLGIGLSPLLAGTLLSAAWNWREYYFLLAAAGGGLGLVFSWQAMSGRVTDGIDGHHESRQSHSSHSSRLAAESADWLSFFLLTLIALMQGFVYSGLMSFLPRYFNESSLRLPGMEGLGTGQVLAGLVLILGCIGQMLSGLFARASRLEWQLAAITFGNAPCLIGMAVTTGWSSVAAAGMFALVHFMHQPIYNSLVAKYTPRSRRSLGYGIGFAMSFGVGGLGAAFAGYSPSHWFSYFSFAGITVFCGCCCLLLWLRIRRLSAGK